MDVTDVHRIFIERTETGQLPSFVGEGMSISHDNVNRFLHREAYSGRDLFNEAKLTLNLKGGTLSVDDSLLETNPIVDLWPWSAIFGQASIITPLKASS